MTVEVIFAQVCDDGLLQARHAYPIDGLRSLPNACIALLDGPVTVCLASRNPNGSVHKSPVGLGRDDTHLFLVLFRGRPNDLNLRARPDVSLLLVDPADPFVRMTVSGVVGDRIEEDDNGHDEWVLDLMNQLAPEVAHVRDAGFASGGTRTLYRICPQQFLLYGR